MKPYEVNAPTSLKGVGDTLLSGLRRLPEKGSGNVLIVLGHTLYLAPLTPGQGCPRAPGLTGDWAMSSPVDTELNRWCYATVGDKPQFLDKPPTGSCPSDMQALIGVYHLSDRALFKRLLADTPGHDLAAALAAYAQAKAIKIISVDSGTWLDCGSLSGLQRTRQQIITRAARSHHSMALDEHVGELAKRTTSRTAILQQYLWYAGLPNELAAIAPRILGFEHARLGSTPQPSVIRMEYYGYATLEEAWLYKGLSLDVWRAILDHLFEILDRFRQYPGDLAAVDYHTVYEGKTRVRLAQLQRLPNPARGVTWKHLLDADYLEFDNGSEKSTKLRGWPLLADRVWTDCENLYSPEDTCLIHGDFQLANILYDPHSRLLKLLDPRGSFGSSTLYGDPKYDLAKLRHSLRGGYNYIVNDLFKSNVTRRAGGLVLSAMRPRPMEQNQVGDLLDQHIERKLGAVGLRQVKLIEGLLFLSMIPLHKDHPARQVAMLATGLKQLNEVVP